MTEKLAAWIPVSDELIVDAGIGAPEEQAAAAQRIDARLRESRERWRSLPFWIRARRRLVARLYEPRHRIGHAWSALRGVDCEP